MKTASKVFLIIGLVWRGLYLIWWTFVLIVAAIVTAGVETDYEYVFASMFASVYGIASIFIALVLLLMIAPGIVLNIIALNKLSHATCKTDISTGLSVCVLIFGSLLGGIFLLCLSDKDFMPTAAVNQTIYYQNVPPVQPTNGYFQGMPNGNPNAYQNPYQNGNPNAYQNPYQNGNPNAYQNPYQNGNPNAYQNPYQNGSPNAYQNAKPTTYPNGNQNTPQDPTPNPNADPAPNETGTTDNGSTKS